MNTHRERIQCAVKEYRQRRGLSQDELARMVGVRRQAVYDMESGRYLPNTAVALRLARALGCTVEMLFGAEPAPAHKAVHLPNKPLGTARVCLAQIREKLVGLPLPEAHTMPFKLEAADAFVLAGNKLDCQLVPTQLANTLLILGCDPALSLLGGLLFRVAPQTRAHTIFASSRQALLATGEGNAHVAGIHYHNSGISQGNIDAALSLAPGMDSLIVAFSAQEEGFMVAPQNPLKIRTVEDLANGKTRLANREPGAALRSLLDAQLARHGLPPAAIPGYSEEVHSHSEGAIRVAGRNADAALGLRVVAEAFGLDFVPLAVTRCDLFIPSDLRSHCGIIALLDILQSSGLRKELESLPGYEASDTGKTIFGQ